MLRFAVLFCLLLVGLFTLEVLDPVDRHVILPFTTGLAHFTTGLISLFDKDAEAIGKMIRSTDVPFAVSIERGCNGVEALIILFSAVFAFPATLRQKLIGFAFGFLAIQGLNIVRIVSLFYIGKWEQSQCLPDVACSKVWFDWFHMYLWQALIILDALVSWLLWLRWLPRSRTGANSPLAPA